MVKHPRSVVVEPDEEAGARLAALMLAAADKTPHGDASDEVRRAGRGHVAARHALLSDT
jgi:hypothetical protein